MKVLLDTCVISEIRHPQGSKKVKSAVSAIPDDGIFISVISIGEIVKCVFLLRESKKKKDLINWLQSLERYYYDRILPIDMEVSHIWGELSASAQKNGKKIASNDGLIAATSIKNGLHTMTRNITDFDQTGALLINPWV